jgi:hypothetical protein
VQRATHYFIAAGFPHGNDGAPAIGTARAQSPRIGDAAVFGITTTLRY